MCHSFRFDGSGGSHGKGDGPVPPRRAVRQGALTVVLTGPNVSAEGRRERDGGERPSLPGFHTQLCVRSAADPGPLPAPWGFIVALVF